MEHPIRAFNKAWEKRLNALLSHEGEQSEVSHLEHYFVSFAKVGRITTYRCEECGLTASRVGTSWFVRGRTIGGEFTFSPMRRVPCRAAAQRAKREEAR